MSHAPGAAFLLAQVGAAATARFADAVAGLGLTPPLAGVLRVLAAGGPSSQRDLAARLGTAPSRVVAYVDDLEERRLVRRSAGPDRRVRLVTLTAAGATLVERLGEVARDHDEAVTASLTPAQRRTLRDLLAVVAADLGLTPGVHPGYRPPDGSGDRPSGGGPTDAARE